MDWLLKIFDKLRPPFQEGGPLNRFKPFFDANEAFFFSPSQKTENSPHVRDPLDIKRFMSMVILAVAPCAALSVYLYGIRMIAIIATSYIVGGLCEVAFSIIRKEEINEGFLVTGLLFPLIVPPGIPLWQVAIGIAFGVIVGKELFGGTGRNLFNPALVARCFTAIAYPVEMTTTWVKHSATGLGNLTKWIELNNDGIIATAIHKVHSTIGLENIFEWVDGKAVDAVSSATPLALAKQGIIVDMKDLFFGTVSGCGGETSALLIIIGGIFLMATRIASWRTIVSAIVSFLATGFLIKAIDPAFGAASLHPISPMWHMLAGGFLFGVMFMATDPVSGPMTQPAKYAYGTLIGVSTMLIRNYTGYVEGVMFAILLANTFAPLFDEVVIRLRLKGGK
jgi:Na(+)-translocating NADH:ubiquinone oxidoreductase B subunit